MSTQLIQALEVLEGKVSDNLILKMTPHSK